MSDPEERTAEQGDYQRHSRQRFGSPRRRRVVIVSCFFAGIALLVLASVMLVVRAATIKAELEAVAQGIPTLKADIAADRRDAASQTVQDLIIHAGRAREAAQDPLWTMVSAIPWAGPNFSAVTEVARSADDVTQLGLAPLVNVYEALDWNTLLPGSSGANLEPVKTGEPRVRAAAYAIRSSLERLEAIDARDLLPQIADPLSKAKSQLMDASSALDSAADAATLAPPMLGASTPRNYLLMVQNNAELRATGGIPGALAVLNLDNGKLSLSSQTSATELGAISPTLPTDPEQQQIYSSRLGKFMQDVNLTPDFPTAAATASDMWEKKTGQKIDGVVSIDPVALSYILRATGPVTLKGPESELSKASGLPGQLTGDNVVSTLLSDVYLKIRQPAEQDTYFAAVAKEIFSALGQGTGRSKGLIAGLSQGAEEGRLLVWSRIPSEQSLIAKYSVSGSISGPSVTPAEFGVYFNDGTGAKMDYYVRRTVQAIKQCPRDGYEETTIRVTSTSTAPADAATSLPPYVTGSGMYGVAAGTVRTNIVVYGPAQANVESAAVNGQRTPFAPYRHSNRPVGVVAEVLAPGESKTVDFTFGKIVQHTEPNLVVTPTVQPVKDTILPTENASCDPGQ